MRIWKPRPILGILLLIGAAALSSSAQQTCPSDKVCVSPEAMKHLLQRDDLATAQESEIKVLKQSVDAYKDIITDLKVQVAKAIGELTGCQQNNVDLRTMNTELIRNYKTRNKVGLINF